MAEFHFLIKELTTSDKHCQLLKFTKCNLLNGIVFEEEKSVYFWIVQSESDILILGENILDTKENVFSQENFKSVEIIPIHDRGF